jgi:hypothetical protein
MGKKSKSLLRNEFFGLIAGLIAYMMLLILNSPWEESVAACLIGSVPGIVDGKKNFLSIGATTSLLGWFIGTFVFDIFLGIGAGAWICAGASVGLISGIFRGSLWRGISGFFLGAIAGLLIEASRFLPVLFKVLRFMDMQFILLGVAGILLPLVAAVVKPEKRK